MSSLEVKLESQNWVLNHTLLTIQEGLACFFLSSWLTHLHHYVFQQVTTFFSWKNVAGYWQISNCSVKWKKSSKALIPAAKALRKTDTIHREVAAYGPPHSFKMNLISLPTAFISQQYRTSL